MTASASTVVDLDAARKQWATLSAKLCLKGYTVWRSDPEDGQQRFSVSRFGAVRELATLAEVERFAAQVGATA